MGVLDVKKTPWTFTLGIEAMFFDAYHLPFFCDGNNEHSGNRVLIHRWL